MNWEIKTKTVEIGNIEIGNNKRLVLISGPCVIESEHLNMHVAEVLKDITEKLGIGFIYKSSYAKDNRSSVQNYYGPGMEKGLKILEKIKTTFQIPILSDVHYPEEVNIAKDILDVIQIPAFLSMQTKLALKVAGTGKPVNVKKAQFVAPDDMRHVIGKLEHGGAKDILLTERGSVFGYHNLVVDMRSFRAMRKLGYPVVFDVTHTVRKYGIPSSDPMGGSPEDVPALARAGVAAGIDAIFIETHPEPHKALSDAYSMLPLSMMEELLKVLIDIDSIVKGY